MNPGALAITLLLACAGASAGTMTTGVRGTVHIAPAHGGPQRIGESSRAPMAGAAVQVLNADHRLVAHVVTGADGQFSAPVPPGEYRLKVDVGDQQKQIILQLANSLQAVITQDLIPRADRKGRALAYEVMVANPAVRRAFDVRDITAATIPFDFVRNARIHQCYELHRLDRNAAIS